MIKFEDPKGVIRSRKSMDRQYNGLREMGQERQYRVYGRQKLHRTLD
jgi:hypothetical protein